MDNGTNEDKLSRASPSGWIDGYVAEIKRNQRALKGFVGDILKGLIFLY